MKFVTQWQIRSCSKLRLDKPFGFALFALALATLLASASAAFAGWPQYGFNAAHTSFNDAESKLTRANVATLKWQWAAETGRKECSMPLIGENRVYSGAHGRVFAFAASDGSLLWSNTSCTGMGFVRMSLGQQALLVADGGFGTGDFAGLNPVTGDFIWCFDESQTTGPTVDDHVFYFNGEKRRQSTGDFIWTANSDAGFAPFNVPAVSDGAVYSTGSSVLAVSAATGREIWHKDLGQQSDLSSPSVSGGIVYVAGTGLHALSAFDGHVLWQTHIVGNEVTMPAVAYGKVFVNSRNPNFGLGAFDATTGALVWSTKMTGTSAAAVTVANGVVYEIAQTGELMMFNSDTGAFLGKLVDPDGRPFATFLSQAAVVDGTVYVSTADPVLKNRVDAFRLPE